MPIEYDEKRDFIRMTAHHDLHYRELASGRLQGGTCQNLSATGILFTTGDRIAKGTRLEVTMTPSYQVVAPLVAEVEVIRAMADEPAGSYRIAGRIIAMQPG